MTAHLLHSAVTSRPIAVTLGDPAGIGPDIALMAWSRRQSLGLQPFYVLGDPALLKRRATLLGIAVAVEASEAGEAGARFGRALPVVDLGSPVAGVPGRPDTADAGAIIGSIVAAVGDVRRGVAAAVVTNPISKHVLHRAGFRHPGHTEFLGELADSWGGGRFGGRYRPVMMLAGPLLRTVPVTVHVPLMQVASLLTRELIVETGVIVARDLRIRFGIAQPRLAVAGLNPHAGESGSLGHEDAAIVAPAVEELRARGIEASGPYPADTMFHARARAGYDAALCMYHDQALIPVKTIGFDETVNVTLGLPFVRSSPDHGTAFDIAGTGAARPDSFIAAVQMAHQLAEAAPVAAHV